MQNAVQIAYNMKLMVQKTYYEKKENKCYKTDIWQNARICTAQQFKYDSIKFLENLYVIDF